MVCTVEQNFYIYIGVLAVMAVICSLILIVQFITVICLLSKCKHAHIWEGEELKRAGSESPLLSHPEEKERVLDEDLRNVSFVRREVDKHAIEAIYGPPEVEEVSFFAEERQVAREVRMEAGRQRRKSGKLPAAAALYLNETAQERMQPQRRVEKFETDKEKIKELSQKFHGDGQIPKGLVVKPEKEEPVEPPPPEPVSKPDKSKKAPVRRRRDPPSVFRGRKERGDFLDEEFADLVEDTNRQLAEYTLAGVVDEEVSIFANQRITEKNMNRSKFEFNQAALNQQKPETHSRKISDQKNLLLMVKSVGEDFDIEIRGKSLDTSVNSVFSRGTDVTALSRDNIIP